MLVIDGDGKYESIYSQPLPKDASDVILCFYRVASGTWYHNCSTGVQSQEFFDVVREGVDYIVLSKGSKQRKGFFTEYNEEFDVFVLTPAYFDTSSIPKDGEKRYWKTHLHFKYVIDRNGYSYVPYKDYDWLPSVFNKIIDAYGSTAKKTPKETNQYCTCHVKSSRIAREYFGDMFCVSGLRYETLIPDTYEYLIKMASVKTLSRQKEIEDVLAIELDDISIKDKRKAYSFVKKHCSYATHSYNYYHWRYFSWSRLDSNFATISSVTDDIVCIRQFQVVPDVNVLDVSNFEHVKNINQVFFYETVRIYITPTDFYVCKNLFGKWYLCKRGLIIDYFEFILLGVDSKALNSSRLKYFVPYIEECLEATKNTKLTEENSRWTFASDAKRASKKLYSILSSKIFESIIKSEYECYKGILSLGGSVSIEKLLKSYFGDDINLAQSSFVKAVGLPSYMFKMVNEHWERATTPAKKHWIIKAIPFFKDVFVDDIDYLKRMNSETFEELLCYYDNYNMFSEKFYMTRGTFARAFRKMIELYGVKNIGSYMAEIIHITELGDSGFFTDNSTGRYYSNFRTNHAYHYIDYINMTHKVKDELIPGPYKFKTIDEMNQAHDNVTYLYNLISEREKEEELRDKLLKQKGKWDKLKYEEEEFSIIPPSDFTDIANEGTALHHCVKTYIDDVSEGETIIMFVRKSNDLSTPFYTLEVKNGKIRQCHGYANSCISQINGLAEFLQRFCKDRKIEYTDGNNILAVGR